VDGLRLPPANHDLNELAAISDLLPVSVVLLQTVTYITAAITVIAVISDIAASTRYQQ
jgi:hypothetical protein